MSTDGKVSAASGVRSYESIAGSWKLACALAVLLGHHLVTIKLLVPDQITWKALFASIQVFAPFQFFFFSGYLAASSLRHSKRPILSMMAGRGLRIYVLVLGALVLGTAGRLLANAVLPSESGSLGTIWPLSTWNGPFSWVEFARHLNPFGFADHTSLNYAIWYLYHELRLVALFPLFRWILLRPRLRTRLGFTLGLLAIAAVFEFKFWQHFPEFRTSPFQTLSFGVFFLFGSEAWIALRGGGVLKGASRTKGLLLLSLGAALILLQPFGLELPIGNPPIRLFPMLLGQTAFFLGLAILIGNPELPPSIRRACDWSVGIYVVHPPLHMFTAWWSVQQGSLLPLWVGMAVSIPLGILFHRLVEAPSQVGVTKFMSWLDRRSSPQGA